LRPFRTGNPDKIRVEDPRKGLSLKGKQKTAPPCQIVDKLFSRLFAYCERDIQDHFPKAVNTIVERRFPKGYLRAGYVMLKEEGGCRFNQQDETDEKRTSLVTTGRTGG
jgi:hypothetical protein